MEGRTAAQSAATLDESGGQIKMATPFQKQPAHGNYTQSENNFNIYTSRNDTRPYRAISFDDLLELAIKPATYSAKDSLPLITPFVADGKTREHAEASLFGAIIVDHDSDNLSRAGVFSLYQVLGVTRLLAFTTWSSTPEDRRWKIVIPIASPVDARVYEAISSGICRHLRADRAQSRKQQGFYLPAMRDGYQFIHLSGEALVPEKGSNHPFMAAARGGWAVIQAEQEKPAPSTVKLPSQGGTIIQLINDAYDLHQLLTAHGYKRVGRKYLSPSSKSREPGISILERDGKQVVYSHHGESDALSCGKYLDVADVLCSLEYGSNRARMIREEAAKLDPEGQRDRRRVWRAGR